MKTLLDLLNEIEEKQMNPIDEAETNMVDEIGKFFVVEKPDPKNSEDNTVENIRKYYTRRNGNANKNILKLNSFDINEIMMTMFKVVLEHKGEQKYRYAMKLIEQDLEITKEERNLAYHEAMEELRQKGGAKDKNLVNGGAKRKTHKRKYKQRAT